MLQMIYWSKPTFSLNKETLAREVKAVLEAARRNNGPLQITGALVFSKDNFIQVLEGPTDFVRRVFERIAVDERHRDVLVLGRRERAVRDFPSWEMAFVPDTPDNQALIESYCGEAGFDPRAIAPEKLFELMKALVVKNAAASVKPLVA